MCVGALVGLSIGMKAFSAAQNYKASKQSAKLKRQAAYAEAATLDRQAVYEQKAGLQNMHALREQEKIRSGQMKAAAGKGLRVGGSVKDAINKYHDNVQRNILLYGDQVSQVMAELRYSAENTRRFGEAGYKANKSIARTNLLGDAFDIGTDIYDWWPSGGGSTSSSYMDRFKTSKAPNTSLYRSH